MSVWWSLRGELVQSCSCTVFCPCTLGLTPPTEGDWQIWAGIGIDKGRFDDTVGHFLGVQQAPIVYRTKGATRIFSVEKVIDGAVRPIAVKNNGEPVMIRNGEYWVAPDVTVVRAEKSRATRCWPQLEFCLTLGRDLPNRPGRVVAVVFRLPSSGGAPQLQPQGAGAARARGGVSVRSRSHRV